MSLFDLKKGLPDLEQLRAKKEQLQAAKKAKQAKAKEDAAKKEAAKQQTNSSTPAIASTVSGSGAGTPGTAAGTPGTEGAGGGAVSSTASAADLQEYSPSAPNNYDEQMKKRKKIQEEEQIRKHQEKEKERQRRAAEGGNQPPDNAAAAYMKKMGWQEGHGLGRDQQGIKAPLVMRKTDQGAGTIQVGTVMPARAPATSKCVVILNAAYPDEVDDELKDEMREEAQRWGKLKNCEIIVMPRGSPPEDSVRIFLEYTNTQEAAEAQFKFHGRSFGGRTVTCGQYPINQFRQKNYFEKVTTG